MVPDLNFLNELGGLILDAAEEAEQKFNELRKINPTHQVALDLYGDYQAAIRNNTQEGQNCKDMANKVERFNKSIDRLAKSSEILFAEDTTVVHVSGAKENTGRIVAVSKGVFHGFGYRKAEVMGHSINILMPQIIAKRHAELMDRFFRTGREIIFGMERDIWALHKEGYCFQIKLIVKPFPQLNDG